jgi:alkyl hydroperoxide reductase subunit AhpC
MMKPPDFSAETTEGTIKFHGMDQRWLGDPVLTPERDFTPVCTTELGYMAD